MDHVARIKESKRPVLLMNILSVFGGSLFLALFSQCSIPLPFTLVPLTLQTFGVLLLGGLLGSKRALFAVLAYIIEGAMGFPVFSQGGAGLIVLLGPKGGYFLGFLAAAFLSGLAMEKRGAKAHIFIFIMCELLILSVGTLWLSFFAGINNALAMGFFPFVLCGMIKAIWAAYSVKLGRKALKQFLK